MNNFFATNLKYLREKKGLDQQQLAELLNVPRTTLSCWENGIRTPKIEKIQTIADILDVDMDIISKDYSNLNNNSNSFNELELLFSKYKDILTDDDKETIKFLIEKRKRDIDNQEDNK